MIEFDMARRDIIDSHEDQNIWNLLNNRDLNFNFSWLDVLFFD